MTVGRDDPLDEGFLDECIDICGMPCVVKPTTEGSSLGMTIVRDAGGGIGLVHELRQLRGAEEFLDGGDDRVDVHQGLRGDLVGFLHAHALAHDALHAGQADTELVLDQLADRADAAVAEVVDKADLYEALKEAEYDKLADLVRNNSRK